MRTSIKASTRAIRETFGSAPSVDIVLHHIEIEKKDDKILGQVINRAITDSF
ncbi:MAG: hypothetical protein ACP6IQ_10485 [Candidatus Njordarchaeia archaeon]